MGALDYITLPKYWVIGYLGIVTCLRKNEIGLQPTASDCAPLVPLTAKIEKGDCLCCTIAMDDVKKWNDAIDKVLTKCLKLSDAGDYFPSNKKECTSMCDAEAFCTVEAQRKYRFSLYSSSAHCLGTNARIDSLGKAFGGAVNKLAKSFGSSANCLEDKVYQYVKDSQTTATKQFEDDRRGRENCMILEPLPPLVEKGDCICCTAGIPPIEKLSWGSNKASILKECMLGFKHIENGVLDKNDCKAYCESAVENGNPECTNTLRKGYAMSFRSKGPHCLAKNSRVSSYGGAFNKLAKSWGSVGNCEADDTFTKSRAAAVELINKMQNTRKSRGGSRDPFNSAGSRDPFNSGSAKAKGKSEGKSWGKASDTLYDDDWGDSGDDDFGGNGRGSGKRDSGRNFNSGGRGSGRQDNRGSGRGGVVAADNDADEFELDELLLDEVGIDESAGVEYLTRYGKIGDSRSFPFVTPRINKITERVDYQWRIAHPFEHICGGARQYRDENEGHDGPTQYISFSNMGQFEEQVGSCRQPFDVGQLRVRISGEQVTEQGGFYFDLSKYSTAYKWCYEGGCITTQKGWEICFEGSRDIAPWPYKCAQRAYQLQIRQRTGSPPDDWWNKTNRERIAQSCAVWALRAREVLVLPNPDKIRAKAKKNGIKVESDREPGVKMCVAGFGDRCVTFNETSGDVCCCNDRDWNGEPKCWVDALCKSKSR